LPNILDGEGIKVKKLQKNLTISLSVIILLVISGGIYHYVNNKNDMGQNNILNTDQKILILTLRSFSPGNSDPPGDKHILTLYENGKLVKEDISYNLDGSYTPIVKTQSSQLDPSHLAQVKNILDKLMKKNCSIKQSPREIFFQLDIFQQEQIKTIKYPNCLEEVDEIKNLLSL
jgi:hypothetical protein